MHVRGFTYLHFFAQRFVCSHKRFAASWLSFRFIEAAIISRFSLPLFGICCVRSNFGLQSQKQLIQHCAGSLCRWSSWMSFLWFSAAIISALFGRFSESNVCIRVLSVQPIDFINDCPTWRGLRHGAPPGPHLFQTSCYSWSVHKIDQFYQTIWNYFHTQTNHIERVFCITSHSFGSTAVQFHFVLFLCSRTSFISQIIFHMLAGRIAERNIRIVTIFGDYLTGWITEWCSATTTFCSKWCLEYKFPAILNGFEKKKMKFKQMKKNRKSCSVFQSIDYLNWFRKYTTRSNIISTNSLIGCTTALTSSHNTVKAKAKAKVKSPQTSNSNNKTTNRQNTFESKHQKYWIKRRRNQKKCKYFHFYTFLLTK